MNLTAPINSSGYGLSSLNVLVELDRRGRTPALWPIGAVEAEQDRHDTLRRALALQAAFDRSAPSLRIWHQWDLAQHVGRGLQVGWPIFELDVLTPREAAHLSRQDVVVVCSDWARGVVAASGVSTPTRVVPLGVDREIFSPTSPRDGPTTFLSVGKWEVRKGHYEILKAFEQAFSPSDDVRLVVHAYNPFLPADRLAHYNSSWVEYYRSSRLAGKIEILPGRLSSQKEVASLMGRADCGLFPSRAEGWNLELLEMMSMGKTVIATLYGGHTAYVNRENALVVDVDTLESAIDNQYFRGQGRWARLGERQVAQMADHMRYVHEQKRKGLLGLNEEGMETARKFSWANAVDCLEEVLDG